MKRTQIQLPDWLFAVADDVAVKREISFAELVRRGLEYMMSITPKAARTRAKWKMPHPHALGSETTFIMPNWREQIHMKNLL